VHISVFDIFKIGIGPSSSHTVGPMRAARRFAQRLEVDGHLAQVTGVKIELFGSLGFTGKGHGTDKAVILGLEGDEPHSVDVDSIAKRVAAVEQAKRIKLLGKHEVALDPATMLIFHRREKLPLHANGMRFTALAGEAPLVERIYYSVGGGFVVDHAGTPADGSTPADQIAVPYPFNSADELLRLANEHGMSLSSLMLENEKALMPEDEVRSRILAIWAAMDACVRRGCEREGILPGGLKVKRRAAALHRKLKSDRSGGTDPLSIMDWVNLFALAVNEENAAGGRVVTAPTNGAAGIIPAVLRYYAEDCRPSDAQRGIRDFLLTAAAIGMLCKQNASISGAEIGCQGEVGVACAMAAAGLVAALGGTNGQIENAAEIGIEHHLGMTCDPIGGLVQIPCIERNGMGAIKAITAASLAMKGDGTHFVSLDDVIETMRQTGFDMQAKYKETSLGGLAIHVVTVNHAAC